MANQPLNFTYPGFLLREIKDFWRVALLMSTLLHKINYDEDLLSKNFQLAELRDLFKAVENTIVELGSSNLF